MADEELPVTLAVSLHAPNDRLRDTMIPINARYPLREVIAAAHGVARRHGRRVTFEYACIEGVNDAPELADELADLLPASGYHVNLIAYNPTGSGFRGSPPARVEAFAHRLQRRGLAASYRRSHGQDIDAACGQLAVRGVRELRRARRLPRHQPSNRK